MIKLWLTRPNIQMSIAYPTPTVEQGMSVINADSQLSEAEKLYVKDFLPNAVDKEENHLFTKPETYCT